MSNSPAFNILTIIPGKDQTKGDRFLEIGAAWRSRNGDTVNLVFDALPVAGNRVILAPNRPKEKQTDPEQTD